MSITAPGALVLATVLLAACGSSTLGTDSHGRSGVADAMASVSGSGAAAETFAYTDLARLRALGIVDPRTHSIDAPWQTTAGVGFGEVASVVAHLPAVTGVDVTAADRAVTIGDPPDTALRIDGGFAASDVTSKLEALGATRRSFDGTGGLSFGGDDQVDADSAIGARLPVGNALNEVVVRSGAFAASPNGTTLTQVLDGGRSLLDLSGYRQIADCLGDVVAAVVTHPRTGSDSALIAEGVRAPAATGHAHEEVVCSIPAVGKAGAVRRAFTQRLSPRAIDPRTGLPVSTHVTATRVDTAGSATRAVLRLRPDSPPGYVISGYLYGAPSYWDGSCPSPGNC